MLASLITILGACGSHDDPGPLAGTWQLEGLVPMTITFRSGETEAMGMIEKVSYRTEGNDVLVTYENGLAKGTTMRYTLTGRNSARTAMGDIKRVH